MDVLEKAAMGEPYLSGFLLRGPRLVEGLGPDGGGGGVFAMLVLTSGFPLHFLAESGRVPRVDGESELADPSGTVGVAELLPVVFAFLARGDLDVFGKRGLPRTRRCVSRTWEAAVD